MYTYICVCIYMYIYYISISISYMYTCVYFYAYIYSDVLLRMLTYSGVCAADAFDSLSGLCQVMEPLPRAWLVGLSYVYLYTYIYIFDTYEDLGKS